MGYPNDKAFAECCSWVRHEQRSGRLYSRYRRTADEQPISLRSCSFCTIACGFRHIPTIVPNFMWRPNRKITPGLSQKCIASMSLPGASRRKRTAIMESSFGRSTGRHGCSRDSTASVRSSPFQYREYPVQQLVACCGLGFHLPH